jgi:hypothetical protein
VLNSEFQKIKRTKNQKAECALDKHLMLLSSRQRKNSLTSNDTDISETGEGKVVPVPLFN